MITAKTQKGTRVWVSLVDDVEPNEGGYYCEIYRNQYGDRYDDFCIHTEDCDCKDDKAVTKFVREYVSSIKEY